MRKNNKKAMVEMVGLLLVLFTVSIGGVLMSKYTTLSAAERTVTNQETQNTYRDMRGIENIYEDIKNGKTVECLEDAGHFMDDFCPLDVDADLLKECLEEKTSAGVEAMGRNYKTYTLNDLIVKGIKETDKELTVNLGTEYNTYIVSKEKEFYNVVNYLIPKLEDRIETTADPCPAVLGVKSYTSYIFDEIHAGVNDGEKIDDTHFLIVYSGAENYCGKYQMKAAVIELDKYADLGDSKWCCIGPKEGEKEWVNFAEAENNEDEYYHYAKRENENGCDTSCEKQCKDQGYKGGGAELKKDQWYADCNQWDHCACTGKKPTWEISNVTNYIIEEAAKAYSDRGNTPHSPTMAKIDDTHFLVIHKSVDGNSYARVLKVNKPANACTKSENFKCDSIYPRIPEEACYKTEEKYNEYDTLQEACKENPDYGISPNFEGLTECSECIKEWSIEVGDKETIPSHKGLTGQSQHTLVKLDDTHYMNFYQVFYAHGGGSWGTSGVTCIIEVDPDTYEINIIGKNTPFSESAKGYAGGGGRDNAPIKMKEDDDYVYVVNAWSAYGTYTGLFKISKTDWSIELPRKYKNDEDDVHGGLILSVMYDRGGGNSLAKINDDYYMHTMRGSRYEDKKGYAHIYKIVDKHYEANWQPVNGLTPEITLTGTKYSIPGWRGSRTYLGFNFDSSQGKYNSLVTLGNNKFLNAYTGSSSRGYATILIADKTTNYADISKTERVNFDNEAYWNNLIKIDKNHYLNVYSGKSIGSCNPYGISIRYYYSGKAVVLEAG